MPKQHPPTAFMLYVHKRKKEMGDEASKWTVEEAVKNIGPDWEALSPAEQLPFKERAKALKVEKRQKALTEVWEDENNERGESAGAGPGTIFGIPG